MKWISPALVILILTFSHSVKADWLMNYYKNPTPDNFVPEVQKLSENGILSNPKHEQTVSVFLSRVLADNPEKTIEWMDELKSLEQKDMKPVFYAVWLSDTDDSKKYLKSIGATKALAAEPTNFLQVPIDNPNILDALWAYFFATGDDAPVKRIISALKYDEYLGSLEAYKTSQKTEQDKNNAIFEAIFTSARWSLESNIKNHPRVAEICEVAFKDPALSNSEKLWLGTVLSKALPSKYTITKAKPGEWTVESK